MRCDHDPAVAKWETDEPGAIMRSLFDLHVKIDRILELLGDDEEEEEDGDDA
jgi:hypothetical protein